PENPPPIRQEDLLKGWTRFSPPNGRVSVLLPGTPKFLTDVRQVKGIDLTTYQYLIKKGQVVYSLAYSDIPGEAPGGKLLERMLDSSREGTLKTLKNGKLLWERRITLDGRPGRDLEFDSPDEGKLVRQRVWLLFGTQVYILLAKRPRDDNSAAEVEAFFDS